MSLVKGSKLFTCLGIESTAHTFGVGVAIENGQILTNIKDIYNPVRGRGIHPRDAAQHHCKVAPSVLKKAFKKTGLTPQDLDAIAISIGPGLGPVLRTGATIARALAVMFNKPLVPVHHAIGHIEIASLTTKAVDPLVVLVSGGHTTLTALSERRWRIFGETEDITLGNLLDMFARAADLPSSGGPVIEALAKKGKKFIDLPYTVKGNDVSYSGLYTAVINKLKENKYSIEDLAFSLQEVAFSMLTEASERCLAHIEKKEILLTGGVAANRRLQEMMKSIAEEHGAEFKVVEKHFSSDCGAQIAWTGLLAYKSDITIPIEKSYVKPKWRLDEVDIPWRTRGLNYAH